MPVVVEVPLNGSTHRLTISSTTAKRLSALPVDQHASFTAGLVSMIASQIKVPEKRKRARTKPKAKKREVAEAIACAT